MSDRAVPVYQSVAVADPDNCGNVIKPNADGSVNIEGTINVTLNPGDFEIGAVEIKDSTTNNRVAVSAAGLLSVDGSGVTQPVSALTLPLPSGAATAAGQASALAEAQNTNTLLGSTATSALQATGNGTLASILTAVTIGPVPVSGAFYPGTQPVSVASLPLAAGAALEAGNLAALALATGTQGTDDDKIIGSLNTIAMILRSIDMRLAELPMFMAIALNKGPSAACNIDTLESFLDSSSTVTH